MKLMQKLNAKDWVPCGDRLPPDAVIVETKIDDSNGVRNEQKLMRHNGLWWFDDMSMYVYYSPTHWREVEGRR